MCIRDSAKSALHDAERNHVVVVDRVRAREGIQVPADCVERSVRAEDGAERRFLLLEESLILPIEVFLAAELGRVLFLNAIDAARGADALIGKVGDEPPNRFRLCLLY